MRSHIFIFVCLSTFAVGTASVVHADTVYLLNGDRITGTLDRVRDGKIVVKTDYAGEVSVDQSAVSGVKTEQPVAVQRADGTVQQGQLTVKDGTQYLDVNGDEQPLPPAELQAAAPDEAALTPPEPKVWSGKVEAGASWHTGSTSSVDSNLKVKATRKTDQRVLTLSGSAGYGEAEGVVNSRRAKAEAKYQFYPDDDWYWYVSQSLEHDTGRKLDLRSGTSLGMGYDVVKRDTLKLSLEGGLDYAYERWRLYTISEKDAKRKAQRGTAIANLETVLRSLREGTPLTAQRLFDSGLTVYRAFDDDLNGTTTDETWAARLAVRYEQKVLTRSTVSEDLTVWPDLENSGEFRATSELAWATPINASLDLKFSLKSEYDSDPGDSANNWDHLFLTSLAYSF